MAIEDATFIVQRGDTHYSCLGSELGSKLLDDDLLIAQRGDNHGSIVKANIQDDDLFVVTDGDNGHKSVTGAQVKALFEPPPPSHCDITVEGDVIRGSLDNVFDGDIENSDGLTTDDKSPILITFPQGLITGERIELYLAQSAPFGHSIFEVNGNRINVEHGYGWNDTTVKELNTIKMTPVENQKSKLMAVRVDGEVLAYDFASC